MSPAVVLGTLAGLGGSVEHVYVVGCEPATVAEGIGLSPAVAAAVEPAADLCVELLSDIVAADWKGDRKMIRRVVAPVILALVVGLVVKSLPDLARYLKIREM